MLIALVSLIPALWIGGKYLYDVTVFSLDFRNWGLRMDLAGSINLWVRIVGTVVASLTLLGVAVRAASSVSGERDRQTLDNLLTTPLKSNDLLWAKWLGSLWSVRWAGLWLGVVWSIGILAGGLFPGTVPWLLLAWTIYAGFLAVVGLWFSVVCRTSLRATIWTLLTVAGLGVGHWYLWLVVCLPLGDDSNPTVQTLAHFQMYGLTPPLALAWLAFRDGDISLLGRNSINWLEWFGRSEDLQAFEAIILGLVFWALAGLLLWWRLSRRFRRATGRVPLVRPTVPPLCGAGFQPANLRPAGSRPHTGRRWRRAVLGMAVLALVALVGYLYLTISAERDLQQALKETDALDPGWRWTDLEASRRLLRSEDNAAQQVQTVIRRNPALRGLGGATSLFETSPLPRRWNPRQKRTITDYFQAGEEVIASAEVLADMPEGRYDFPRRSNRDPLFNPLDHLDETLFISRSRFLDCELAMRAEEGKSDEALQIGRAMINLGRSVGDEPLALSQSLRAAIVCDGIRGLEHVLAQGEPSGPALAATQSLLEREDAHPDVLIALRGLRALLDERLAEVQAGGPIPWFLGNRAPVPRGNHFERPLDRLSYAILPGSAARNRAALLRHMNRRVEAARLPSEQQPDALAQLNFEIGELPFLAREVVLRVPGIATPFSAKGELRCAMAGLAAERFRRDHGRWPRELAELVPAYLDHVPQDPFAGTPLNFGRKKDGLEISALRVTGAATSFRLWDVAQRRQEPLPESGPAAGGSATPLGPPVMTSGLPSFPGMPSASVPSLPPAPPLQLRTTLTGHSWPVLAVAFRPDGQMLASASADRTIRIWDTVSGKNGAILREKTRWIHCLAFSPDGKILASGREDNTIALWDLATGQMTATLKGHTGRISSLAFRPDGKVLASGSQGTTIKLWDVASGRNMATFGGPTQAVRSWVPSTFPGPTQEMEFLVFSPSGKTVAWRDTNGAGLIWDLVRGKNSAWGPPGSGFSFVFLPDGKTLAATIANGVTLWDVDTGNVLASLPNPNGLLSIALAPHGKTLAVSSMGKIEVYEWTRAASFRQAFWVQSEECRFLEFSPDGKTLAVNGRDGSIWFLDVAARKYFATLPNPSRATIFSPDGQTLASWGEDETIKLWDIGGSRRAGR